MALCIFCSVQTTLDRDANKYCLEGKEKLLSLYAYPDTSLADAREKHAAARKQLQAGKGDLIKQVKTLPAEGLKALTTQALETELAAWPNEIPSLLTWLGDFNDSPDAWRRGTASGKNRSTSHSEWVSQSRSHLLMCR